MKHSAAGVVGGVWDAVAALGPLPGLLECSHVQRREAGRVAALQRELDGAPHAGTPVVTLLARNWNDSPSLAGLLARCARRLFPVAPRWLPQVALS